MSTTSIELRPIHWDILKLIRALCYEGLPETEWGLVDPNDRWLTRWEPNPHNTRITLPNGVPEPLVRACLIAVPFEDAEQRWGKGGHAPDPILQYLVDRGLLDVCDGILPICAVFRNLFNDVEIRSTILYQDTQNGRSYVWKTYFDSSGLREQDGSLVTNSRYRVFKLTERAQELLDSEGIADTKKPASDDRVIGLTIKPESATHPKPSHVRAKALYEWAMETIDGAEGMTYAELFAKLTNDTRCGGEGLPNSAETFARYCRAAGIRRNAPRSARGTTRTVRRVSDL